MICPACGYIDKNIDIPDTSKEKFFLGICKECDTKIFCIPAQKRREESQIETVKLGEEREEKLVKVYLKYYDGTTSQKRPASSDIDSEIFDESGNLICYLEIKERSNTINAYRETKFPYAKIDEAKRLIKETGKPVLIVLKFADCWARLKVEQDRYYKKGKKPFAPRYRPHQRIKERQIPVLIQVEELEILRIKEECRKEFDI